MNSMMKAGALAFVLALSLSLHAATTETQALTDAQITKIVATTNSGEIELAKMAKEKTTNPEVKTFADHMIKDHEANNQKSMGLVAKMKVTPEESVKNAEMNTKNEMTKAKLSVLSGKEFDRAYMDGMVKAHQQVLENLDKMLIPNAQNGELKDLLTKTKVKVTEHMDHAQKVSKSLQ